jgi:SnoaL-like domain
MDSDQVAAIERLIAKDEIIDLVHRYSCCVDHRLYDEVVELFMEEPGTIVEAGNRIDAQGDLLVLTHPAP